MHLYPGRVRLTCTTALVMVFAVSAAAQSPQSADGGFNTAASASAAVSRLTAAIEGPPPPAAPETIARDEQGRATVRAVRLTAPLRLDGRLDDEIYNVVPGAGGFIQQEPREGETATEQTEIWIFFDDRNVYVAARCWDSGDPAQWVVNELQRDGDVTQNESLSIQFDTFYDRRNGVFFQSSPAGALRDQAFTDEGNQNLSWNAVWDVRSARFDGGWSYEMVIPFKSLRYAGSGPQVWGVQLRRIVKWKNEISYLTRVPNAYGMQGPFYASVFGTLVGLETPAQSVNLDIKPYLASAVTTDRAAAAPYSNDFSPNAGFDIKYGLSRSLTADLTYNPDFAQVEEDVQQLNLTRFSLFFPEKREFFLEGQGIFAFGGAAVSGFGGGQAANDVPILFFSRRVGLSQGQSVPVVAGGRVTGKAGAFSIGALNIQTDDKPSARALSTNFSVLRLKRDVLRRSNIGLIAAHRSRTIADTGSNLTLGLDANLQFFRNVSVTSYLARTDTPGLRGGDTSYRAQFDYAADRYGLMAERVMVGEHFNPEIGFTRRTDFRRDSALLRFSPRPRGSGLVRKYTSQLTYDYVTNAEGSRLENRDIRANFRSDFNSSDNWSVDYVRSLEQLPETFEIAPGVRLPAGTYHYQYVRSQYGFGQQRMLSGRVSASRGSFYGGDRTEFGIGAGRVNVSPHFSMEPGVTLNWVDLPQGRFRHRLITTRTIVMPSPRMAFSSLVQYNATTHTLSSSARLRWEYTPGSEMFVVYSEGRDTLSRGTPELMNRSFVVKITRLLRF